MEKQILQKQLFSILNDVQRLQNALYALNMADIQRYPQNYEVLSVDAALRSEAITCHLRHLIYATTAVKKSEYLNSATNIQGIEIAYKNEILTIKLPALLPKRKQWASSEFLLDPLYFALDNFIRQNDLPKYEECVVCFAHVYNQQLATGRIRDYDNLEIKQFLDCIATFVLADDTSLLCDTYSSIEFADNDYTVIYVMAKNRFGAWLAKRQNA